MSRDSNIDSISTLRRLRFCTFALLALGWAASGYLLLRMSALGSVRILWKPGISAGTLCAGCDEALTNAYTGIPLGIPLPGMGLVYFAGIAFLLAVGSAWAIRLALLVSAAGAGVGLALSLSLLSSGTLCFLCLLIHAANLVLLAMLYTQLRAEPFRGQEKPRLFSLRVWSLLALLIMATSGILWAGLSRPTVDARKILAEYRSAPVFDIPADPADATLGPPSGRVRLVVFSSFQCIWCQKLTPWLRYLNEHYADKLTIVFKNYPLGKACNPVLPGDMQPRACAAAWAAEAANLQKGFWRFHDGLFSYSLEDSEEILRAAARGAGLDLARWEQDRQSVEVRRKIVTDVSLGHLLGVNGTPTVFLNGRKINAVSLPVLQVLIREEIRKAARS